MADDYSVAKQILVELGIRADKFLSTMERIRSDTDGVKNSLLEMSAASKETGAVINSAFKSDNIDKVTASIAKLKAELALLDTSGVTSGDPQFTTLTTQIAKLEEGLARLKIAASIAGKETSSLITNIPAALKGRSLSDILIGDTTKFTQFDNLTKSFENQLRDLVSSGMSLDSAYNQLQQSTQGLDGATAPLRTALSNVKSEMRQIPTIGDKIVKIFGRIGAAFAIGLALNAIRQIIQGLKDIAQAGRDAAEEVLQLNLEVRNLQRAGFDTTISSWNNLVDELGEKFTQFSEKDIRSGLGQIAKLQRQLGLTDEQVSSLVENIALLATTTGVDFANAMETAINAIERGRVSNALSDLVGPLNEATLESEALARGLEDVNGEVGKYERALLLLQIVSEEANASGEEFAARQDHITGLLNEEENAIEKLKEKIGKGLLPIQLVWLGSLHSLLEILSAVIHVLKGAFIVAISAAIASLLTWKHVVTSLWEDGELLNYFDTFYENFDKITRKFAEWAGDIEAPDFTGPVIPDIEKDVDDAIDSLDELENAFIKLREAVIDANASMAKENRKYMQDMAEDERKFALKLDQLREKLQFDIGGVNDDYNKKLADKNQEYREKELKAEEDYWEKLRRLRENFLLDFEDAVRVGDAAQARRLIRQFNLRKSQLDREKEDEANDLARNRRKELKELKDARDDRIAELQKEFAFRQKQLIEQQALERSLRAEDHKNRLAEIRIQAQERIDELLRGFVDEELITQKHAETIAKIFADMYGSGGEIDRIYDFLVARAVQAAQQVAGAFSALRAIAGTAPSWLPNSDPGSPSKGFNPTISNVASPEIIKDYMSIYRANGGRDLSSFAPQSSSMMLQIGLDQGLTANIVNQSAGVVADVLEGRLQ